MAVPSLSCSRVSHTFTAGEESLIFLKCVKNFQVSGGLLQQHKVTCLFFSCEW